MQPFQKQKPDQFGPVSITQHVYKNALRHQSPLERRAHNLEHVEHTSRVRDQPKKYLSHILPMLNFIVRIAVTRLIELKRLFPNTYAEKSGNFWHFLWELLIMTPAEIQCKTLTIQKGPTSIRILSIIMIMNCITIFINFRTTHARHGRQIIQKINIEPDNTNTLGHAIYHFARSPTFEL